MSTDLDQNVPVQRRMKQPGSGRTKGTLNKLTRTVKDVLTSTFNELQAMDGHVPKYPGAHMLDWAIREPGEFYKVAARLIPTEISGAAPITVQIVKFSDCSDTDGPTPAA